MGEGAKKIRVVMVDDHALFRESLRLLLGGAADVEMVGTCGTALEARVLVAREKPDVLLLDYDLGEETALPLLAHLAERAGDTRVLLVTAGVPDDVVCRVMEGGCRGIVTKQQDPGLLLGAIRRVHAGEVWLEERMLQALLAGKRTRDGAERARPLTERQASVLKGIFDGLTNKEIAWKLQTSETSVKAVIQELFRKAGVRTRAQLVRVAIEKHAGDWLGSA